MRQRERDSLTYHPARHTLQGISVHPDTKPGARRPETPSIYSRSCYPLSSGTRDSCLPAERKDAHTCPKKDTAGRYFLYLPMLNVHSTLLNVCLPMRNIRSTSVNISHQAEGEIFPTGHNTFSTAYKILHIYIIYERARARGNRHINISGISLRNQQCTRKGG